MQVNARRKLTSGGQAKRISGGPQGSFSAHAGTRRKGPDDGRRFGLGKQVRWRVPAEGALGSGLCSLATAREAARRDRKRAWSQHAATTAGDNPEVAVDAPRKTGRPLLRQRWTGCGPRLVLRRQFAASLEIGDAFGQVDASSEDVGSNPFQAFGRRPTAEGEVGEMRVSRSGIGGLQGCTLTTSRLQR